MPAQVGWVRVCAANSARGYGTGVMMYVMILFFAMISLCRVAVVHITGPAERKVAFGDGVTEFASLSGGQLRRCSLAVNFGFAEMVAMRGNFRPSLCVLDEPLTHLDRSGRSDVGRVLRLLLSQDAERGSRLNVSTILMILQDLIAEELEEAFDFIDEVVKKNGQSSVRVDGTVG